MKYACLFLLVVILIQPSVLAASKLDPLFNTTYVQRYAEHGIDFYSNVTVAWKLNNSCTIRNIQNMTRIRATCDNEPYQILIPKINSTAMIITAGGINITISEDQEVGLDIDKDSEIEVDLVVSDIKFDKAEIVLRNRCSPPEPQTIGAFLEENGQFLLMLVGFVLLFFVVWRYWK